MSALRPSPSEARAEVVDEDAGWHREMAPEDELAAAVRAAV